MIYSESLIKCLWRYLVAGFPAYVALHLVISITPLLNAHLHPAALCEWGGRRSFGKVSQANTGDNGSKLHDREEEPCGSSCTVL